MFAPVIETDIWCRICLDNNDIKNFIVPCECNGTIKYVHRECLNKWRYSYNSNYQRYTTCGTCNSLYDIKYKSYSYISLVCYGIWDMCVLTLRLHILYMCLGCLSYTFGYRSILNSDNKYMIMYVNGIFITQLCIFIIYIRRMGLNYQVNNIDSYVLFIIGIFIMSFIFIYYDYLTKQYYRRLYG